MGPEVFFWQLAWQVPAIGWPAIFFAFVIAINLAGLVGAISWAFADNACQRAASYMIAWAIFVGSFWCTFEWLVVTWGGS